MVNKRKIGGKRSGGRKPLLARADILAEVKRLGELGAKDKEIYQQLGINSETWANALKKAQADEAVGHFSSLYVRFARVLRSARSRGVTRVLGDLQLQSKSGNDRASKLLLELDAEYRPDNGTSHGVTININNVRTLTDEEIERALSSGKRPALPALPDITIEKPE